MGVRGTFAGSRAVYILCAARSSGSDVAQLCVAGARESTRVLEEARERV